MQVLQREYSSDNVDQWLNRKGITCAIKLWPVVVVVGSIMGHKGTVLGAIVCLCIVSKNKLVRFFSGSWHLAPGERADF